MGHFGRAPITRVWLILVFPACILSYLGQGALVLGDPDSISSPFFLLVPGWARLPMVLLATAATVIASQAVITGAFSVTQQAAQIGYLPRLRIAHTSEERKGQIYVPWINWALMASVLTLVLTFKSSAALAYAFGMAVTGTITITTLLFFYIARYQWRRPLWIVAPGAGALLTVDLLFFAANLTKLVHGAWLPLLIAIAVFTILTTWQRGRELVTRQRQQRRGTAAGVHRPAPRDETTAAPGAGHRGLPQPRQGHRAAGAAGKRGTQPRPAPVRPHPAIETLPVPHVPAGQRITIDALGHKDDRITHVMARFGYMDEANVPALLPRIREADPESPLRRRRRCPTSCPRSSCARGNTPGMSRWRKRLFFATSQITADAAEYFRLPRERTVIMGSRIEL